MINFGLQLFIIALAAAVLTGKAMAQDIKPACADVAPKPIASDAVTPTLRSLKQDKRVECSFFNLAVVQLVYFYTRIPEADFSGLGYLAFLLHSLVSNKIYQELVEQWVTKEITSEKIIERGVINGNAHKIYGGLSFIGDIEQGVCVLYDALWKQMIKTCYYTSLEKDYKSVAALLYQGFVYGVFDLEIAAKDFPVICPKYDVRATQAPTRQPT